MRTAVLTRGQENMLGMVIGTAVLLLLSILAILWQGQAGTTGIDLGVFAAQKEALAAGMPEWQCSHQGNVRDQCIDLLLAEGTTGAAGNLGRSRVTLEYITPEWEQRTITLYDNTPVTFDEKASSRTFINVYDALAGRTLFGTLTTEVYS